MDSGAVTQDGDLSVTLYALESERAPPHKEKPDNNGKGKGKIKPDSEPAPEPVSRNIDLSWTPPETRTDGSPVSLSEIGGYKIYVGTAPGTYGSAIDAGNTTVYTLNAIGVGTYYMAISAYDSGAIESAKSTEFVVTVN